MNDIYNAGDLLFMPSYNELFPMAILESCSANRPLLLRNLELYEDILFGNYILGADNDDFEKEVRRLADDKEYYGKAVKMSQEISKYYSRDNVKDIWIDFYTRVYNEKK